MVRLPRMRGLQAVYMLTICGYGMQITTMFLLTVEVAQAEEEQTGTQFTRGALMARPFFNLGAIGEGPAPLA